MPVSFHYLRSPRGGSANGTRAVVSRGRSGPVARTWNDVVYTCRHKRPFCSESCVSNWLPISGNGRDYVLDLDTLWRLAWGWYDGRIERSDSRREPAAAREYLRADGSTGEFWSLEKTGAADSLRPMRGCRGSECSAHPEAAQIQARSSARSAGDRRPSQQLVEDRGGCGNQCDASL
jgi:hypothetical protein